jgi:hypothetical protein
MWGSGDTAVTLVRHESVMAEVAGGAPTLATNAPDTAAAWHAVTVPRRVAPSAATNAMGVCLVCEKGEEGHKCSDLEGSSMSNRMLPVPPLGHPMTGIAVAASYASIAAKLRRMMSSASRLSSNASASKSRAASCSTSDHDAERIAPSSS